MIISRIVSLVLRVLILASSAIVAGIVGNYLKGMGDINAKPGVRFIYTEVVAGISLLASIILLIPTTWALTVVPFDIIVFILWVSSAPLTLKQPLTVLDRLFRSAGRLHCSPEML